MKSAYDIIEKAGACDEALEWVAGGRFKTLDEVWNACTNPAWMIWWLDECASLPASELQKTFGRDWLTWCSCGGDECNEKLPSPVLIRQHYPTMPVPKKKLGDE